MKKILKLSLGFMIALVLFFGNVSMGPLTEHDVTEVHAAKIKLNKTKLSLYVKKTATLKVNGTKKKAKWSSSSKKVATVSNKGKVTAVKAGKATITAKIGKKKYKCTVTVKNPTISKTTASVYVGKTVNLKVSNAVGKVTWSSSNKKVATVTGGGVVKGVAKGTATITAKASGVNLTCKVTVKNIAVTGLNIDQEAAELKIGETVALNPVVLPANATNKGFTVSSSDEAVASVDEKGLVTAKKDGTATITVKAKEGNFEKACAITVKTELKEVTVDEGKFTVDVGKTAKFEYKTVPEGVEVKKASFTSSNAEAASVDESGMITGLKSGTATIEATVEDNYGNVKTVSKDVTVIQHVESINLGAADATVYLEGTYTNQSTVLPEDANDKSLTYTSSKPEVAVVDESGQVTPKAEGTTTITVTSKDNPAVSATMEITVKDAVKATVKNEAELIEALKNTELERLIVATDDSLNMTIPAGEYPNVSLIVNAPNGHIVNYAKFKDVTIQAISKTTYVEHADNTIYYAAQSGSVEVAEDAVAAINVVEGAGSLNLINNGNVSSMTVTAANTDINVSGDSSQLFMPVSVTPTAKGTGISTSRDLNITADTKIDLEIKSGGETTSVTVDTASSIPDVTGHGRIQVTVSDTGTVENIVAENTDQGETTTYSVSGIISDAEGNEVDGAKVYLLPYNSAITVENIDVAAAVKTATTANGKYTFDEVLVGNYFIYIKENGYTPVLDTLILYNEAHGQGKNYTIVPSSDVEVKGTIQGTLLDAETGNRVPEGLTIYLREGLNNVSGAYIAYTQTDNQGTFTFEEIALGQYTVQVLDQREDQTERYLSYSYGVTVANEGINTANESITKIIGDDMVRFRLTWGNEASGASSDLDSHMVGPMKGGIGQFHTWYSDRIYGDDEVESYTDLDTDDTTWEGPETTTIRVKENGIYSFYIYDYTNQGCGTQLRRSSAHVSVTMGGKELGSFTCPNEDGGLWYVCDYDATTNKLITKNIVSDFTEGSENVGVDMLARYQGLLSQAINKVEGVFAENPSLADKLTGTTIENAKNILNTSDDYSQLSEQYNYLNAFLESMNENLSIESIYMYDAEGNNQLTNWYTDYYDDDLRVLELKGLQAEMSALTVNVDEGSTAEVVASDQEGYTKALKVTNSYGISRIYHIRYTQETQLIYSINSYYTDDDGYRHDRIENWYYDSSDDEQILVIEGTAENLPDDLDITGKADAVSISIETSDKAAYKKKVIVSYGGVSTTYYIVYKVYGALKIRSIDAMDAEGNYLISDWDWDYDYDDSDNKYYYVDIYGYTPTLPDNLEIKGYCDFVTPVLKTSDKSGYDKMIALSYNGESRNYYINYYFSPSFGFGSIQALDANGDNLINDWDWDNYWDDEDNEYYRLDIYGDAPTLPDNLAITGRNSYVTSQILNSDRTGFDKMVVLTCGDRSRTYYIVYHGSTPEDEDMNYTEDEIRTVEDEVAAEEAPVVEEPAADAVDEVEAIEEPTTEADVSEEVEAATETTTEAEAEVEEVEEAEEATTETAAEAGE